MFDNTSVPRTSEAGRDLLRPRPPFNARPVCAAGRESRSTEGPYSTHYTATASWLYINRVSGSDRFGPVPDGYTLRGDLVATGRCHPQKLPPRLRLGDTLWREADDAAALEGPRGISATHIVADLPRDADPARWVWLVENYAYRHLVDKGMIVDWAIHWRDSADGTLPGTPHVHLLASARFWRQNGRVGSRQWQWLANADQMRTAEDDWFRFTGMQTALAA
ncbi:MobA/MobL family protein [Sphingomonas sp. HMP6]|uniref:MobA/MobL family protein n=1 Tax=Sphingomonas sp. HMP6 TaxID=1517551 RepID=UPI0015965C32|nr:MobA/MobL family protein [Sphingomonas sp. HMP6]BCA59471.1 hypothetical protein HMP06_2240 [Sphingomonas sp. HMP6]